MSDWVWPESRFWIAWLIVRFVLYATHKGLFMAWVIRARGDDILTCIWCRPMSDPDMQYNISRTFSLGLNDESGEVGYYGDSERFQSMSVGPVTYCLVGSAFWLVPIIGMANRPYTGFNKTCLAVYSVMHFVVIVLPYLVATIGVQLTIQEMRATAEGTVVEGPAFARFLVSTVVVWAIGPMAEWLVCSSLGCIYDARDESEAPHQPAGCLLSAVCEEDTEEVEMDDGRWSPYDEDVRTDARPAWETPRQEEIDDMRWTQHSGGVGTGARPDAPWKNEEMDDPPCATWRAQSQLSSSAGDTAEVLGAGAHARAVPRRRLLPGSPTEFGRCGTADATSPRVQGQKVSVPQRPSSALSVSEMPSSALSVPQRPSRAGLPRRSSKTPRSPRSFINWGAGNEVAPTGSAALEPNYRRAGEAALGHFRSHDQPV
ncbi:hypothetical protein DIPPA_29895 [Diplonema papillatum]|nr:hypothetical protein DIPPA_29895 [Diplonema papillatum]